MDVQEILTRAQDAPDVRRVFGEPIERDGVLIVPVAAVRGGGGGGGGSGGEGTQSGEGSGAGFGLAARAAGVFVIKGGDAQWRPAVDLNRVILGGQIVGIIALLVLRSLFRRR
jgi:uncharacterized spore protein YtfJ